VGLINVPLASTAVGVVEPAQAGMASGINSTLRQVGTATGIAALGSIFAGTVHSSVVSSLGSTPLRSVAGRIATGVANGAGRPHVHGALSAVQKLVERAALGGFVHGLNEILWIGAAICFLAGALCLVLIRKKDFTASHTGEAPARPTRADPEPSLERV
ncbi:MAG: MFS transporter, partial [Acidimicrobiales bacterium]